MDRNTKIILAIAGGLLALCVCMAVGAFFALRYAGQSLQQSVTLDPAQVAEVGDRIADYAMPDGYREKFALSMLNIDMVAIGPTNETGDSMVLMLMQFPPQMTYNEEQMKQQAEQALGQQINRRGFTVTVTDQRTVTIRGETTTLTITEGYTEQGTQIRQAFAVFSGKNGPVMLMAMGSQTAWDEDALASFMDSIH
jgi:hypothetical protein